MTRRNYETEADLERENSAATIIQQWTNAMLVKLPKKYGFDYAAMRYGRIVSFIEVKFRTSEMGKYDSYMISLGKIQAGDSLSRVANVPSFLFVFWTDDAAYVNLDEFTFSMGFGGREDRNDSQDREPVCFIPIEEFKLLRLNEQTKVQGL
jgi:hypothetical protein